ncbi:hypothetical protein HCJ66_01090 [Listeria sp. FSL L7-1582]|uniref:hypothetical protein n=1 Tax=Listeria portnoyi TaxID=2713504 RepID=UPI00164E8A07|nr:hypothetical protein [Listeria portnoyi]MBC6308137.1 hypothetical protein [Listeria portnoyi]
MPSGVVVEESCFYCNQPVYEEDWAMDFSSKDGRFLVHDECTKKNNPNYYNLAHSTKQELLDELHAEGLFKK